MNVLLVENEPEIRSLLKTALEIRGHQVSDHADGKAGWVAYQNQSFPLIIVDCSLPGRDRLELCQKIRGYAKGYESLILVITASNRFGNLGLVLAAGADDHLEKPFDLQHLSIRLAIAEQRINTLQQQSANIESLRKSNELLNETQHIAQVGSWKHDLRTNELICSAGIFHLLEINKPTSPITYDMLLEMVHPEDRDRFSQTFNNSVAKQNLWEITLRLLMPDGRIKWVNERCETISDDLGKPLFTVGSIQDITNRKQSEDALRESERRWNLSLEAGGYGVWDWNLQSNALILSKAGKAMFGYSEDEIGNNADEWKSLIHPDDYPQLTEKLRVFFHDKADKFCIEYRIRCKDQTWKWVLAHGIVSSRADDGLVMGMIGTYSDITLQKNSELELQFAASVYQAVGEAVIITDNNNCIIAANQAFEELTGYSAQEVIGKTPSFMYSTRHDEAFLQAMSIKLNATGIWEGEIWNRHKNGEDFAVWQLIHTIYGDDGYTLRRVALFSNVTAQKRAEEKIRRQAYYDLLTGLPNRRLFQDRLGLEIRKAIRANLPIALLFIDLDRFKEINDTLGHEAGDILLQEAALRIRTCVRQSDTVARLGGDEFTVILSELPDTRHTDNVAQKILNRLSEPYRIDDETVQVSASIGITVFPNDANNIGSLMKNADQAMYIAKSQGRNRFNHFAASPDQTEQLRINLVYDLRGAMAAGQLKVYYQPIIDLSSGRIHKAEAQLRWHHPTHGTINPLDFIPLVEDVGIIIQIENWVFKESANFAKQCISQFADDFQVSLNISPIQFEGDHNSISLNWLQYMQEIGLPGKNIIFEINEERLPHTLPSLKDKIQVFRDAGIQIALDYFVGESSSLTKLKKLGIDYLKIDQSLILNFAHITDDLALSEIIVLAHKLGFKVIAIGVDMEGQHDLLTAAKCDCAQGKLYSQAVLPEELNALVHHRFVAQNPVEINIANEISDQALLTEDEAADLLQPHMQGKTIKTWLSNDRNENSLIPFLLVKGFPHYRLADLKNFINTIRKSSGRFVEFRNRLIADRRKVSDRRYNSAMATGSAVATQPQNNRRRRTDMDSNLDTSFDRRAAAGQDRRGQPRQSVH